MIVGLLNDGLESMSWQGFLDYLTLAANRHLLNLVLEHSCQSDFCQGSNFLAPGYAFPLPFYSIYSLASHPVINQHIHISSAPCSFSNAYPTSKFSVLPTCSSYLGITYYMDYLPRQPNHTALGLPHCPSISISFWTFELANSTPVPWVRVPLIPFTRPKGRVPGHFTKSSNSKKSE